MNRPTPSIDEVFFAAMEQPSPEARAAYLDEVCGADLDLRRRVERLLDAQPKLGSFLDSPAAGPTVDLPPSQAMEGPGTVIGPFKLLEQIGEGGMGIVYMAEQTQPVRRKVALKIIKPGMDTKQVIARFEAERQALAMMDHPNIAKVLDAGATESGRPYFVMELVRGIPITEYCDQNRLTIPERLNLFKQVCQAVQHAHQKGIIHRDIKPTNVLVTSLDGVPLPRIIDFGIAKATGQSLTDKTLFTGFAQLIGTPLYMSPEQAEMSAVDIDTRSDIYSLGVLLYELLTGTTPFDQDTFRTAALDEMRRIIREEEPPKPSTRLSTLGATLTTISTNRQTDAGKLNRSLRGELDWIVMKALEKDRTRRYETANGLARDVERYLAGDPVEAGPPSGWYRIRKFARRNRVALMTAGLVGLALIAGTAVSAWQAFRAARAERTAIRAEAAARQERDKARQAVDDMYTEVAQQWLSQQASLEPVQLKFLQKALEYYQQFAQEAKADPKARLQTAIAYRRVADIQEKLGHAADCESACHRAITILEELVAGPRSIPEYRYQLAASEVTLGRLLHGIAPDRGSEPVWRRAIALLEQLTVDAPSSAEYRFELARSHNFLAGVLRDTDHEGALAAVRRAVALLEGLVAEWPSEAKYRHGLATAYGNLGLHLADNRRPPEEKRDASRRAVEVAEKLVSDFPSASEFRVILAANLRNLAQLWGGDNRSSETERLYRRAIEHEERVAAESPTVPRYRLHLATDLGNLGGVLLNSGRHREAEPPIRRAVALFDRLVADSPAPPQPRKFLAGELCALGKLLAQSERVHEAEIELRRAIDLLLRLPAEDRAPEACKRNLASSRCDLALVLRAVGRESEAQHELRAAIEILQNGTQDESMTLLAAILATGPDLRLRDPRRARQVAEVAVVKAPRSGDAYQILGISHYRLGDWKSAVTALEKSVELKDGGDPVDGFFLAMSHWQRGDKARAGSWYQKGLDLMEKSNPRDWDLQRFRAEAAALLGIPDQPTPTPKKEENTTQRSKP